MKESDVIFCEEGGCAAKLGPKTLSKVLSKLPKAYDANLLVGFESSDDASVYKISDEVAIVNTLDFFPPMIEDPYIFGQIAATNALSDIYAMGAEVKTALNIVCFPKTWDLNILGKVMQGGSEKVIEAGAVLVGGHSINDTSMKYGLSVSGTINPSKILCNNTCKENDLIILTKPIGVGIVMSANKVKMASKESFDQAIKSMTTLNKYASEIIRKYNVNACTDVTGFGLLGHLGEMVGDKYSAILEAKHVPLIKDAKTYVENGIITCGAYKLRTNLEDTIEINIDDMSLIEVFFDPQTSGGLLFSINEEEAPSILKEMQDKDINAKVIGKVTKKKDKKIYIQ